LRVLYLIDSLVPGGAERSLASMAPYLIKGGVELEVATLHERPGLQAELAEAGAQLHCVDGAGGRAGWIYRAARLIGDRHPDLVHTTLFEADLAGRTAATLRRTPVVSSLVNVAYGPGQRPTDGANPLKLRAAQLLDGVSARPVVRFHAISVHIAELMARRLHLAGNRIEVIPRGRDADRLGMRNPERRARARAALQLDERTPLVLAAARHERQKGLDILLEALPTVLRNVPAARLVIAGRTGNDTPLLQAVIDRLELQAVVQVLDARSDVPELLCAADVFVAPSRWEGLGSVLLEAMALEAPIVASDLPAVRELVDDGESALLVPPGQPEALAAAIVFVLTGRAAAERRAREARECFLAYFTVDRIAKQMLAFYARALSDGQ
jgi:glycosyltransferase involved in cell wall biosynthesis